jgi:hypothetical protein
MPTLSGRRRYGRGRWSADPARHATMQIAKPRTNGSSRALTYLNAVW